MSESHLENRVNQWPELYLPNFKLSDTSKDLIYPKWFEGNWLVTSQDIINYSEAYLSDLTISDNHGHWHGGLFIWTGSNVTINNSIITQNNKVGLIYH